MVAGTLGMVVDSKTEYRAGLRPHDIFIPQGKLDPLSFGPLPYPQEKLPTTSLWASLISAHAAVRVSPIAALFGEDFLWVSFFPQPVLLAHMLPVRGFPRPLVGELCG